MQDRDKLIRMATLLAAVGQIDISADAVVIDTRNAATERMHHLAADELTKLRKQAKRTLEAYQRAFPDIGLEQIYDISDVIFPAVTKSITESIHQTHEHDANQENV